VGADEALITISKTITDITLPRIAIYRIEQNQTIPTIIDNIGYPAYRFICLIKMTAQVTKNKNFDSFLRLFQ